MKKFPKEILVNWEEPGNDDPFMVIHENPIDAAIIGEKVRVGVYKLVEVKTITTNIVIR